MNFYRRCLPHAAAVQAPLFIYTQNSKKNDQRIIDWTPEALQAFEQTKSDLAEATLLCHSLAEAKTRLISDASDFAMGASLEQFVEGTWKPLAFFSKKFNPSQCKYSAYDRELTAIYEAIKHFKYFLEGRNFKVVTDQKPLTFAFKQKADKASSRQRRQFCFISQFTTCIEHLPGKDNVVSDSLSRIDMIRLPANIEMPELAKHQLEDPELKELLRTDSKAPKHSLNLKSIELGHDCIKLFCDLTGKILRPFVPKVLRRQVFELYHSFSHPGPGVTDQLIWQKYVWPNMHRDIKTWSKECLDCQQSKVSCHVRNEPSQFIAPDDRFRHVHMDLVGPLPPCEGYFYLLTIIDRFSRWVEAIPLRNISAATVLRAFQENWVARFGVRRFLTTDQGSQFESRIFNAYLSFISRQRKRTVTYHSAVNGMVECWHRSVKAALMCHKDPN